MPTLDFKGKYHIYAHHLAVPYRPLVPDPAKSVGDDGGNPPEHFTRTENGERRTESGERRTENGERRTENGERRT